MSRGHRVTALAATLLLGVAACSGTSAQGGTTADDGWSAGEPPLETEWTSKVGPAEALPEYPRPQLARPSLSQPEWLNLNGLWQFQEWNGEDSIPFGQDLQEEVLVPFPIESALSGIQDYAEFFLYRTKVQVPEQYSAPGSRVRINFGGVTHEATVYVNGQEVAHHSGSYDAFSADITDALTPSGEQEIVVAVHSPVDSAMIPVGKQRLEPGGIFYTASSGIWQTVWVESVPEVSLAALVSTANIETGSFTVKPTLYGDSLGTTIKIDAFSGGKLVGSVEGPAEAPLELALSDRKLWSPEDPHLYTLKATLSSGDQIESYAALRQIAIERINEKQHITLNGQKAYLLATLDQGYWPDGIYTAPTDEALKFDIERTKELGFNTIRKHVKVEPARWYYWTDVLGMMVWQDIPSLPNGRNDQIYEVDQLNFTDETERIVDQFSFFPSVIGWVINNEGWGQWSSQGIKDLANQVKQQDPHRLVIARSGVNCCDSPGDIYAGDIIDWHAYQGPAFPDPDRDRAAIDGEHGGLSLPIEGHAWPGVNLDPYGGVSNQEELTRGYVDNTVALRDWAPSFHMSGSVYTQITDVESEQNGLFTYDRKVLKVDREAVRKINLETIEAGSKP